MRVLWVWTGYYFPNLKLWTWHEENGYSYLMDALTWFSVWDYEWDTSSLDSMIDSLADEVFNFPMTCQMRGPHDYKNDWLDDAIMRIKDFDADCGVFCGHMACKNCWGAVRPLKRRIKEETGMPIHILEADAWDERITPFPGSRKSLKSFTPPWSYKLALLDSSSRVNLQ